MKLAIETLCGRIVLLGLGWILLNVLRRKRVRLITHQWLVFACFSAAVVLLARALSIPWYNTWLPLVLITGSIVLWRPLFLNSVPYSFLAATIIAAVGVFSASTYEPLQRQNLTYYWFISGEVAGYTVIILGLGLAYELVRPWIPSTSTTDSVRPDPGQSSC